MDRKRYNEIDLLRVFGIIGVIIIHILTYNLTGPISRFFWNYLQFVVIAFVFCSGFVLSVVYKNSFSTISQTLSWYKKRFIRLVIPFYIYLVAHFAFWILFPNIFSGLGLNNNPNFFVKSVLFIGGTNINWLPLIFLQLMFLFPFFTHWINKKKILFVYIFFSVFITLIFTFFQFPYNHYQLVMWVPWSLVLILAIFLAGKEKLDKTILQTNKRYLFFGLITFIGFLVFSFYNIYVEKSLNFYDNKYPPGFYYLFFGISLTCFFLVIAKMRIWENETIKKIYYFISKNSYQIFFIHYIILDAVLVVSKKIVFINNPIIQFIIIFFPSLFIALIFEKLLKLRKKKVV